MTKALEAGGPGKEFKSHGRKLGSLGKRFGRQKVIIEVFDGVRETMDELEVRWTREGAWKKS